MGKTGPAGAKGEQGIPGEGLNPDWPAIAEISWPHNGQVSAEGAIQILGRLNVVMSASMSPETTNAQPQVIQVLFEPGFNQQLILMQMAYIQGDCKLAAQKIDWRPRGDTSQLIKIFSGSGGRVFIRVHCNGLLDSDKRPFSASCDVLHGTQTPHIPGGVLESWFTIGSATDA